MKAKKVIEGLFEAPASIHNNCSGYKVFIKSMLTAVKEEVKITEEQAKLLSASVSKMTKKDKIHFTEALPVATWINSLQ